MPSLEEAWKGMELAWAQDHPATYNRAARILALAGFELGGLRTCNSAACGSVQPDGSTWRCRYCGPRAQIERLGK